MLRVKVGYFPCVRGAFHFNDSQDIAHSSDTSKGPRVELRGREANIVSLVSGILIGTSLTTDYLHLDALR